MAVYKVLKPIILAGRVEAGETVEISDSEASAFGPEYLEKIGAEKIRKPRRPIKSSEENSTV